MIMKNLRYFTFALVALVALVSCTKEDNWKPGDPTNPDGYNVYFSTSNPSSYVLGLSDNSITVKVERESGNSAISVPITAFSETQGVFTAPATVEFAAGETSKDIVVKFENADPFVAYSVTLSLPEAYTKPYAQQDGKYPQFSAQVLQEDFKVVATGTYYDDFWYEDSWSQDLEYSELTGIYRFSNVWMPGYGFTFMWDKATNKFGLPSKVATGVVHSSYGMISATAQEFTYNSEENAIYMLFNWTVSAGSFGSYYNVFYF